MAAVRALVAPRLAAASAFAPLHAPAPRAALHSSAPRPRARVALVLSGCGVYDGTELHEASAVLVHLSRGGAEVQIFAPDVPQMHVIDHTKGQPSESETRNVLTESARIARGKITDLARLSAADHDAAIFPGGFGAAKNLRVRRPPRCVTGDVPTQAQPAKPRGLAAQCPRTMGSSRPASRTAGGHSRTRCGPGSREGGDRGRRSPTPPSFPAAPHGGGSERPPETKPPGCRVLCGPVQTVGCWGPLTRSTQICSDLTLSMSSVRPPRPAPRSQLGAVTQHQEQGLVNRWGEAGQSPTRWIPECETPPECRSLW
uniref:ES1 protein homolog, mitochondrial n=1 Tax=Felis catus TaxID=9685 RepID=A0ABI7YVX4_FELCA